MPDARPTLIYDGDCGICKYWVRYWQCLTGGRVDYQPYQNAAAAYPQIAPDAFRLAIQFIGPDGSVYSGAAAAFRVLRYAPGHGWWLLLYEHVPAFAPVTEWTYRFFARRRGLLNRLTQVLWGPALEPPRHDLARWVFLRLLGLIYIAAFASLSVQILGLVGSAGALPVEPYLREAHQYFGTHAYLLLPTLFWVNASDTALLAGTLAGMALGVLVALGIAVRPALVGLFALYLSYTYAGQAFMTFQWDLLLLEAGFLAIFLTGNSRIVVWLYRWLVFRYLFMAGAVKLLSGDPTWHQLSALVYHFETQPLPTPLAWYAAHLPRWLLSTGTAVALTVEVALVFLILAPRRLRAAAAWGVIAFQLSIAFTGNYNFFNLLTMLLCIFLFDDAALHGVLPVRLVGWVAKQPRRPDRSATMIATVVALILVPVGINRIWRLFWESDLPVAGALTAVVAPLLIVNPYGLFAIMTTTRPEIVVEGSEDRQSWREYSFRYKPGELSRSPSWNIPHQPRLDWQMWFAALDDSPPWWFATFMRRLLENSPSVLSLLGPSPFPDHAPKYVRALLYEYRFADAKTHKETGQWWVRRFVGYYFPAVSLAEFERTSELGTKAKDSPPCKRWPLPCSPAFLVISYDRLCTRYTGERRAHYVSEFAKSRRTCRGFSSIGSPCETRMRVSASMSAHSSSCPRKALVSFTSINFTGVGTCASLPAKPARRNSQPPTPDSLRMLPIRSFNTSVVPPGRRTRSAPSCSRVPGTVMNCTLVSAKLGPVVSTATAFSTSLRAPSGATTCRCG